MIKSSVGTSGAPSVHLLLILTFQLVFVSQLNQVGCYQQQQQQAPGVSAEHTISLGSEQAAPMMSLGGESSSALENAASGDDLIAAESSPAEGVEHKAFTSGQALRQDIMQQVAASPAPNQLGQMKVAPQPGGQQQQQQLAYNNQVHPQHHLANLRQQQGAAPHQKAAFNPFIAAALAGNYGPAQQQMAAASLQGNRPLQGHHVLVQGQPGQHPQMLAQASVQAPARVQLHPQQQQAVPQHQLHPQQLYQQQQVQQGLQQQHQIQAQAQLQREQAPLSVQESSVRNNIVPAPPAVAAAQQQQQQQPNFVQAESSIQFGSSNAGASEQGSDQQVALASVQHPSIAASGSSAIVSSSGQEASSPSSWPLQAPDIPKIVNLEVKCEKNLMKVSIEFDKIFNGVIFSKGHYSQNQCVHLAQNSGKQQAYFDISINTCGTQGNTQNGLYGMGGNTGSGTFFENTIVIQYDPNVQEVYDHARKLRCTWHDQYEKAVTFRPFPVDMLDIVRADFAGDNVGCWMQIQVGKGPWASEVAGIVKIGQTMTMVLAIKDEENKFDMLVRNCFAHDGKRGPIELVDKAGCITRPKLMSRFTKIKNFGSSATVLSYAHFQAFKFPDSMEVHFQCTIQICRHQCPEQCSGSSNTIGGASGGPGESYGESTISGSLNIGSGQPPAGPEPQLRKYGGGLNRERRDLEQQQHVNGSQLLYNNRGQQHHFKRAHALEPNTKMVGVNRIIQVVSTGDLAFALQQQLQRSNSSDQDGDQLAAIEGSNAEQLQRVELASQICMSSYNFVLSLVVLALLLLCSCLIAISLYWRQLNYSRANSKQKQLYYASSGCSSPAGSLSSSSSTSTLRHNQVPTHQHNNNMGQLYN